MPDQYFGKYTGIVKDNRDDAGLGQVKVSVPAIFPPDELASARPALPYGYHFVPENGAKVWVEFEGGDPGLALWTGVQYVTGEWPAEARSDPPQLRVVRSAAGHLLLLDDRGGAEQLRLADGAHQHSLTFDADGIALKEGAAGHHVTLSSQGIRAELAGGATIEMTADGITLKEGAAGHRVTLSSQGIRAELAGGATIEMTAAGTKVDAGPGIVEVKGSLVKLGQGTSPVIRVGDSGIGNLGAPVIMTVTTNTQVTA